MNWQDPAAIAGYIAVGGSGFVALILKARSVWIRDKRDTTYDTEQTKWVEGLQSEIKQLRMDKDNMFAQRLKDVVEIAEKDATIKYLTTEMERMRSLMLEMDTKMNTMRLRLAAIDQTMSSATGPAPLGKL